jgi:hypothetical protein
MIESYNTHLQSTTEVNSHVHSDIKKLIQLLNTFTKFCNVFVCVRIFIHTQKVAGNVSQIYQKVSQIPTNK